MPQSIARPLPPALLSHAPTHPERQAFLTLHIDTWNPDFSQKSPLFGTLTSECFTQFRQRHTWPDSEMLNRIAATLQPELSAQGGAAIKFVAAANAHDASEHATTGQYETNIYLTGQVQTRPQCWHDFFGALCWMLFPKSKAALNALHYDAFTTRSRTAPTHNTRSPIENAATLFDESGAVVISSDPALIDMIKSMQWKELFWHHRERVRTHLRVIIFGHALYEKALNPYIGLTAQTLLCNVSEMELKEITNGEVDQRIAHWWNPSRTPRDLFPLPILGIPGLSPDNECENYYDNINYFRTSRRLRV